MTDGHRLDRVPISAAKLAETMQAAAHALRLGNPGQAERLCTRILDHDPDNVDALCLKGVVAVHAGRIEDGVSMLETAVALDPDYPPVLAELARAYAAAGKPALSVRHFRAALEHVPDQASLHQELGNALLEIGEGEEAARSYRRALEIRPDFTAAWNNLGVALRRLGQREQSLSHFHKAVECDPYNVDAQTNIAVELRDRGSIDAAIEHCSRLLERHPDHPDIRLHRALCLLLRGDFRRGWSEYEHRSRDQAAERFLLGNKPRWNGEPLEGQTLWIGHEQGVGDQIMYATCLPQLLLRAKQCFVSCDQRLAELFRRSFPSATIVGHEDFAGCRDELESRVTTQTSLASVPGLLGIGAPSLPRQDRPLQPDPHLVRRWKSRLAALGDGLKVGISWHGGGNPETVLSRTIPLDRWAPLRSVPDVHYVNLQYDKRSGELAGLRKRCGWAIHDWEDLRPLDEVENIAACLACLDLTISVDNSTVHLAGALGAPVWILLPFVPDWRWLLGTERSYWYPSARLLRQHEPDDWDGVIEDARQRLSATAVEKGRALTGDY